MKLLFILNFTIYLNSWFSWPLAGLLISKAKSREKKLFKMDYFAKVLFSVQTHHLKKIKRLNLSCFLSAKGKLSQKSKAFWTNLVCDAIWQKSGSGHIVPDCLAMIHFSSKSQASTKILSEMEVAPRHTWHLSFFLHGQNFWRIKFVAETQDDTYWWEGTQMLPVPPLRTRTKF